MQVLSWTQLTVRDAPGRVDRLCFGSPVSTTRRHRNPDDPKPLATLYRFVSGQRFGLVRWRRDSSGRQRRILAVLEALPPAPQMLNPSRLNSHEMGREGRMPLGAGDEAEGCYLLDDLVPAVRVHLLLEQLGPAGGDGVLDLMLDWLAELRRHGIDPGELHPLYLRGVAHRLLTDHHPLWPEPRDYLTQERTCES
jgi:hypothetical protein